MKLEQYFASTKGTGVMSTCDGKGEVNSAIYSRPHVEGKKEVTFIMLDRRSHVNLMENKHACYLFLEEGHAYQGLRLYLTFLEENTGNLTRSGFAEFCPTTNDIVIRQINENKISFITLYLYLSI